MPACFREESTEEGENQTLRLCATFYEEMFHIFGITKSMFETGFMAQRG